MLTRQATRQLVRARSKFQVTPPTCVRRRAGVRVGDVLEARADGNGISLTPASLLESELALAPRDVKQGRVKGPFKTAKAVIRSLRSAAP
jgi:bifunctional DNA-binding transcriptional regulator/antitoxin component of YhaV-PrlF toxin-antitoxin module